MRGFPFCFSIPAITFAETYAYRDRIASEWRLNLINLLPEKTVAEQEAEHGLLYQSAPDQCCRLRKVEPLFKAVAGYRVWLTGLRREQAKSRAALEESALFTLPGGKQVLSLRRWRSGRRAMCGTPANNCRFRCCRSMSAATPRSAASLARRFHSIRTIRARAVGPAARWNAAFTSRQRRRNNAGATELRKVMEYVIGFVIALFIALTGVGAGTITVPVLVLFLGVPAPVAVGIGLMFATAVKLILVPAQIAAPQRGLADAWVHAAGRCARRDYWVAVSEASGQRRIAESAECDAGNDLVTTAAGRSSLLSPMRQNPQPQDSSPWLAWLMFPVGAEVGFSSAGAGALGWAALLSLTAWSPRKWWAQILPLALSSRSSAAARIGSRTPPTRSC